MLSNLWYWYCCRTQRKWLKIPLSMLAEFETTIAQQGGRVSYRPTALVVTAEDKEILFNYELFYALRWELGRGLRSFLARLDFERRGTRLVCDCRKPKLYRRSTNSASRIMLPTIPESVDFVPGYFLKGAPRPGAVVFDVGAYCGEMTLALSETVGPTGKVIAFEPSAKNRGWLKKNIRDFGYTNITVVDCGLWGPGQARLSQSGGPDTQLLDANAKGDLVKTIRFEDACANFGVPEFVKMDIEGAEIEVIESSLDSLRKYSIHFAIATYHVRDGKPTAERIEALLKSAGYTAETGYPEHLTTWGSPIAKK